MGGILRTCTAAFVAMTALVLSASAFEQNLTSEPLAFPSDYRGRWIHTHTNLNLDQSDPRYGYHNVYVNKAGVEASRNGTPYPDGSKLMIVFYEIEKTDTGYAQGKLIKYTLMVKDRTRFRETAGWGFAMFGPDTKAKQIDQVKDCFTCHTMRKNTDYVFSHFVN